VPRQVGRSALWCRQPRPGGLRGPRRCPITHQLWAPGPDLLNLDAWATGDLATRAGFGRIAWASNIASCHDGSSGRTLAGCCSSDVFPFVYLAINAGISRVAGCACSGRVRRSHPSKEHNESNGRRRRICGAAVGSVTVVTLSVASASPATSLSAPNLGFAPITTNVLPCSANGLMQVANDKRNQPVTPTQLMQAGDSATPVNAPTTSNKVGRVNDMIAVASEEFAAGGIWQINPDRGGVRASRLAGELLPRGDRPRQGRQPLPRRRGSGWRDLRGRAERHPRPDQGRHAVLPGRKLHRPDRLEAGVEPRECVGRSQRRGAILFDRPEDFDEANGRVYFAVSEPAGDGAPGAAPRTKS
jgi:hypothetical protein